MSNETVVDRQHPVRRSQRGTSRAIAARKFTAAACVTATPFGVPVDPEV